MEDQIDPDQNGIATSHLRDIAEEKLSKLQDTPRELKEKTPEEIVYELHVHQIELEMQNVELERVQLQLEDSRDK